MEGPESFNGRPLLELRERLLSRKQIMPGRKTVLQQYRCTFLFAFMAVLLTAVVVYDACTTDDITALHFTVFALSVAWMLIALISFCFALGPARERMQDYQLLGKLGEGAFGTVYHARHKERREDVALKIKAMDNPHRLDFSEAMRMAACKHPNVVRLVDMFMVYQDIGVWSRVLYARSPWSLCLAVEYCSDGALDDQIEKWASLSRDVWLNVSETLDMFLKIARGLDHMHQKDIAHLDLKPANIFISTEGKEVREVKIGDLGLAQEVTQLSLDIANGKAHGVCGTPGYIAPELWINATHVPGSGKRGSALIPAASAQSPYSTVADVWSVACILVDVRLPSREGGWSIQEVVNDYCRFQDIEEINFDDNWPYYGDEEEGRHNMAIFMILENPRIQEDGIKDIITHCLEPDPKKRWASKQLMDFLEQRRSGS